MIRPTYLLTYIPFDGFSLILFMIKKMNFVFFQKNGRDNFFIYYLAYILPFLRLKNQDDNQKMYLPTWGHNTILPWTMPSFYSPILHIKQLLKVWYYLYIILKEIEFSDECFLRKKKVSTFNKMKTVPKGKFPALLCFSCYLGSIVK